VDFIEVKNGIFVKAESIEAVIDTFDDPEILCKVYTPTNSFPSILPSSVILEMIGVKEDVSNQSNETQEKMLNIMKQQTNFVG